MAFDFVPIWILAILLTLDVWATGRAVLDPLSTPWQKLAQLLFVWLLPFAGALFVLFMLCMVSAPPRTRGEPSLMPAWLSLASYGLFQSGGARHDGNTDCFHGDGGGDCGGDGGGGD